MYHVRDVLILVVCALGPVSTSPGRIELSEVRRTVQLLHRLCKAELTKGRENIDLLIETKAAQARRLARVHTTETDEVVTEQRLAMAE